MHVLNSRTFTSLLQLDFHTRYMRSESVKACALLILKSFDDDITQLPRYLKFAVSFMSPSRTLSGAWSFSGVPRSIYSVWFLLMCRPTESAHSSIVCSRLCALYISSDKRAISTAKLRSVMYSAGYRLDFLELVVKPDSSPTSEMVFLRT